MSKNSRLTSKAELNRGSKQTVTSGLTRKFSLRIGQISSIDKDNNKINIKWLYPMIGLLSDIDISTPYIGYKSGIRFLPEVGSILAVGFAEDIPVILSYNLPMNFGDMKNMAKDPYGNNTYIKDLNEGEISLTSIQNSEIYLHDDVEIRDSGVDSIILNSTDSSITLESLQLYMKNEAGKIDMGMITRNGKIITDTGGSVTEITGGNALTELKITINELADASINSSSVSNKSLAEITVGTVVDDSGNILATSDGEQIALQIKMSSGALIVIDKKGKMYVQAEQLNINSGYDKPADSIAKPSQQRAAREGDRVTIPLSFLLPPDQVHPGLNIQGLLNLTTMTQLAASFMSPVGPCTFIPVPNLKLFGQITQGSSDVFIGSNDKLAEIQENLNNS
jgi:hypothetical protein